MEGRYFIGIDLHRNYFTFYSSNEKGEEEMKDKLPNSEKAIDYLLRKFKETPEVVIEATRNWMWMVKALKDRGCKVVLAHPLKTKAIA